MGLFGISAAVVSPLQAITNIVKNTEEEINPVTDKPTTIGILQTTDVHCQIYPHDELFWENNKAVFRKTGGYANMATMLNNLKRKNPKHVCY